MKTILEGINSRVEDEEWNRDLEDKSNGKHLS